MVYTLRLFFSSKCSLFHNSNVFGSCIIHILYAGCAKIKTNNSGAKRLKHTATLNRWMKMQQPSNLTDLCWGFRWDATPSRWVRVSGRFEGSCCPYCRRSSSAGRISSRLLDPESRKHYVLSKRLETLAQRNGVTSQKTWILDNATVQTLNPVYPYYSS